MNTLTTTLRAISKAVSKMIQTWSRGEDRQVGLLKRIADDLIADGLGNPVLFEGAGKGKEQTKPYATTMVALYQSLSASKQKLLTIDAKLLTKKQKQSKREVINQATSKMSKLRSELVGRLSDKDAAIYAKHLEAKKKARSTGGSQGQNTPAVTPATPATPATPDIPESTPLKSYIEKVSTGREVIKKMPPSKMTSTKMAKIEKLIGDLIEELNSIK
tara:strand:- start:689 stop:1339 length:651 start_codon:yes stop_codon:yes gene_type:complete